MGFSATPSGRGQYSDCDRLRATAHRVYAIRGRPVTWREGLLWGSAALWCFTAAPASASQNCRACRWPSWRRDKTWWIATAAATAIGLCLLAFRSAAWAAVLGLGLIALPHLIGAPLFAGIHSEVPAALSHRFIVV